jgi:N-acetyl-anhydromuramyl-L-alanine amidase AmpD
MNIEWKGNGNTNFSSREGVKPFVIVDHVAEGSLGSVDNWFTDPKNKVASAHFCVGVNGEIHQYVKIENYAWANGLSQNDWINAPAPVIRDMNCNPNYYTVSIEHEGNDGDLTEAQFYASCWLHRYIMDYCNDKWGVGMNLGSYNVIGHNQVDPKRKPCCPGDKFPWERMRAELAVAERTTLADYSLRVTDILSGTDRRARAYDVVLRINSLWEKVAKKDKFEAEALDKLILVETDMKARDILLP